MKVQDIIALDKDIDESIRHFEQAAELNEAGVARMDALIARCQS